MISPGKLASLEYKSMLRKCMRILDQAVQALSLGVPEDFAYLGQICRVLVSSRNSPADPVGILCNKYIDELGQSTATNRLDANTHSGVPHLSDTNDPKLEPSSDRKPDYNRDPSNARLLWILADLSQLLHTELGCDRADWDFTIAPGSCLDSSKRQICARTVVLDRIRSPFNVGSLFRTADSFGVDTMLLVNPTADPLHPRAQRTSMGCTETVDWKTVDEDALAAEIAGRPVFALELGGCMIDDFTFPLDGVVIVGSEELGVSPALLALAGASLGRVGIPLHGTKGSLNVSVAFGILMHAWDRALTQPQRILAAGHTNQGDPISGH